jgi:hypothetical protein
VHDCDTDCCQVVPEDEELTTRSVDGVSGSRRVPDAGGAAQSLTLLEPQMWSGPIRAMPVLNHLDVCCGDPVVPAA